jgi:hypothetical protein
MRRVSPTASGGVPSSSSARHEAPRASGAVDAESQARRRVSPTASPTASGAVPSSGSARREAPSGGEARSTERRRGERCSTEQRLREARRTKRRRGMRHRAAVGRVAQYAVRAAAALCAAAARCSKHRAAVAAREAPSGGCKRAEHDNRIERRRRREARAPSGGCKRAEHDNRGERSSGCAAAAALCAATARCSKHRAAVAARGACTEWRLRARRARQPR